MSAGAELLSPESLAARAAADGWPRAREPLGTARFRATADDFQVTEQLGFDPDGEGEFALLRVAKVEIDTAAVATELARAAKVPARAVGWAGRKDRRARAEQWFCVHLPGRDGPDWVGLGGVGWEVLAAHRHRRKLRVGALESNRFRIVLGKVSASAEAFQERTRAIAVEGVPDYFGPQRFGRGGRNVLSAASGRLGRRNARSMALSAARSAIFNAVLAARVADGSWNRILPGEVFMLRGTRSIFGPEAEGAQAELSARVAAGDIDPTGPLWGQGVLRTTGDARQLEAAIAAACPALASVLEDAGMKQERRRLRLVPQDLVAELLAPETWCLSFTLESGAYATSVVREFVAMAGDD